MNPATRVKKQAQAFRAALLALDQLEEVQVPPTPPCEFPIFFPHGGPKLVVGMACDPWHTQRAQGFLKAQGFPGGE